LAAAEARDSFEIILPSEGAWLVRLCARLSGNADASEDLAQETLLEAWRHRWKLQDPSGRLSWLAAIAGNVCARWRHAQARHGAEYYEGQRGIEIESPGESVPDKFDLEVELEHHELVDLLSRAMAMLPAGTRTVLIERYVRDATHAEIGERLNLSEGAVRVRVHRGKVALERVLTEHFTEDLVAYGFGASDPTPWESTRIWCPLCGNRRLTIRVDRALGTVISRCGDCCPEVDDNITETQDRRVAEGLKSHKAIFSRQLSLVTRWQERLSVGQGACARCGDPSGVKIAAQRRSGLWPCEYGWVARCRTCHNTSFVAAHGLALALPDTQRFWRRYPRIRALPQREVEVNGVQALVVPFASTTGSARLDVIATRSDFRVMGIHESPINMDAPIPNDR